jgi:predicted nucleotidyltransferase
MARQNLLRSRAGPKIAVDPAQVARVVEEVFPEALGVWIFGSYAQGRARRDSDLDIAILPDRPIDAWHRIERAQDVAVGVHREVDLVDPSTVSDLLRYEVASSGVRVAARDPERCTLFELASMTKFFDQSLMLRGWMQDIKDRGSVY